MGADLFNAVKQWEEGMAYKEVTSGDDIYWINLEQVAYIRKTPDGSLIQFSALSDSHSLSLHANETPEQILGGGVSTVRV